MTDITALISQLAAAEEEYDKVGRPLELKRKALRQQIADEMVEAERREVVDEVSGYRAVLTQGMKDSYDSEKLLLMEPFQRYPELIEDVLKTEVSPYAVKDLIEAGILTRTQLQREGALVTSPRTKPFIKLEKI